MSNTITTGQQDWTNQELELGFKLMRDYWDAASPENRASMSFIPTLSEMIRIARQVTAQGNCGAY